MTFCGSGCLCGQLNGASKSGRQGLLLCQGVGARTVASHLLLGAQASFLHWGQGGGSPSQFQKMRRRGWGDSHICQSP